MLRHLWAPDPEVVDLPAVVETFVCHLMLAACHPDDAPGPDPAGLALNGLNAVTVSVVECQIVPGRPERNQHGVTRPGQFGKDHGFGLGALVGAVHISILPGTAPEEKQPHGELNPGLLAENQRSLPLDDEAMVIAYAAEESNPDRRLRGAPRCPLRQRRVKYPARESNPGPLIKSQLHRPNACGAGNCIRLPADCLLCIPFSSHVGRAGVEPGCAHVISVPL